MMEEEKESKQEEPAEPKAKIAADVVINAMPDALILLDPNGVILSINPAYTRMLGWKPEERIGKSFDELKESIKPEDMERFMKLLGKLVETGHVEPIETLIRTKDGREVPISVAYSLIKDAVGNPKNIIAVLRDITKLKKMEEEKVKAIVAAAEAKTEEEAKIKEKTLAELEYELMIRHQAIETSTGGIAIADMDGKLTDVNWSFLFLWGYKEKEDIIGKVITDFCSKESAEQGKNLIERVKKEGLWKGELIGLHKDGRKLPVDVNASLLLDRWDESMGITCFFTDITERKQTEEKMREVSKMTALGQFVAGAAHEINNPLSIITTLAQHIVHKFEKTNHKELKPKEFIDLIEDLDMIYKQAMRCGGITQSLLAFGRREKDVEKVPISINKVLGEVLRMIGHQLELSKIEVIDKRDALPLLMANSSRMSQVFMNLILNAQQSMPRGGKLEIKSQKIGIENKDWVRIEIADTGEGISNENLPRVFEPFFTTRKVGEGAGLGLSIVYSVVKEHGGEIGIESKLWNGTKVIITLPVGQT